MFYRILFLSLFFIPCGSSARAATTFTVNSVSDTVDYNPGDGRCHTLSSGSKDNCTLRAAIMEANATRGLDTIQISRAGTYELSLTGSDDVARVGDLDITEKVNIYGTSGVIIDASLLGDRIFHVTDVYIVNLKDLTLQYGGGSTTTYGGAIYSEGGSIYIRNVDIENSTATFGGGIFMDEGTLHVYAPYSLNFTGNTASPGSGGAVYIYGSGTFTMGTARGGSSANFTSNSSDSGGGALYTSTTSTTSLSNATFTSNTTSASGGAIYNLGAMTLTDTTVENNTSTTSGGGIGNSNVATLTIVSTQFSGNTSGTSVYDGAGGAIWNYGDLNVTDSVFSANSSTRSGGAIYHHDTEYYAGGDMVVESSSFDSNTADEYGGAIHDDSTGGNDRITSSTFNSNSSATYGGAIWAEMGTLSLEDVTIDGNTSGYGGGIYVDEDMVLTVTNSLLHDNSARYGGGVMLTTDASAAFVNSTISGNTASSYGGGINSAGWLDLSSVTLYDNAATSYNGGGLYNNSLYGDGIIRNSIIAGNTAGSNGDDCYTASAITSDGYNLIGDIYNCGLSTAATDQTGDSSGSGVLDPRLDVLADNGGETWTHALLARSPALNAGNTAGCTDGTSTLTTDQRGAGYSRTVAGTCDIGAYEVQ